MFYRTYGLKDFEVTKNKDIAKMYGISEGRSCQKVMSIIKWIRKDTELCEQLSELINN
jgi:DNA-directed RNA polymerase specialized sigma subunit